MKKKKKVSCLHFEDEDNVCLSTLDDEISRRQVYLASLEAGLEREGRDPCVCPFTEDFKKCPYYKEPFFS